MNLLEFTSCLMAKAGTCPAKIVRCNYAEATIGGCLRTMDEITFAVNPPPQTFPALLTERKRTPLRRLAEAIQTSTADLTQPGTGTVRM